MAILVLAFLSWACHGQTRCPQGAAPGSVMCGPDNLGSAAGPRYAGRWHKTWGALAASQAGDIGVSVSARTKGRAKKEAIARCEANKNGDCEVVSYFFNECFAVSASKSGMGGYGVGSTKERAGKAAEKYCQGDSTCKVFVIECTEPYFEEY